jgi:hypothetical protein
MAITLDGTAGINTSGTLVATGSLTTSSSLTTGTGSIYNGIQASTAVTSTSGTSIPFTNIPSWVKRISIILSGVSTSGTSAKQIQLGTSGGFEVTSYLGGGSSFTSSLGTENNTTGFLIRSNAAADIIHGVITIVNITENTWVSSGTYALSSSPETGISAGTKALSGALTQVRLTTINGTDTFDAGTINITYE